MHYNASVEDIFKQRRFSFEQVREYFVLKDSSITPINYLSSIIMSCNIVLFENKAFDRKWCQSPFI